MHQNTKTRPSGTQGTSGTVETIHDWHHTIVYNVVEFCIGTYGHLEGQRKALLFNGNLNHNHTLTGSNGWENSTCHQTAAMQIKYYANGTHEAVKLGQMAP